MPSPKLTGVLLAIILAAVGMVLWVYPSQTDFAPSNRRWNGLSEAMREFSLVPLPSLDRLPRTAQTVLLVVPSLEPRAEQVAALRRYVENGGTLVLMNDSGFGNTILAGLGLRARFGDRLLVDPLFSHRSRRLPRIVDLAGGPLVEGVEVLVLNHAGVISVSEGTRIEARSSLSSFLDANGNGRRDPDEAQGPFPVVALARAGPGRVVMISDASIATNGMLELGDNRRFLRNLFGLAGEREVFLDASLLPRAPMDVAKLALGRARELFGYPAAAFVVIAVSLAVPVILWLKPPGGGG